MPIKFEYLDKSDLTIDETYNGDVSLGSGGDPICKILKVQNSGGFRFIGKSKNLEIPYCAYILPYLIQIGQILLIR